MSEFPKNIVKNDTLEFESFDNLITYYNKKEDSIRSLITDLKKGKKFINNTTNDSLKNLDAYQNEISTERKKSIFKFIISNKKDKENIYGFKFFIGDWRIHYNFLDSLYQLYPQNVRESAEGKMIFKMLDKRKPSETQKTYDIAALEQVFYDTDGKEIILKNISSKYILLDFWASWCSPCRIENKQLIKEKETIEKEGNIKIIAISLDDNKDKWLKASKADNLNYLNICDFRGLESDIAKAFKINVIPHNVIITKEGAIIANNLWGEDLLKFIRLL